MEISFKQITEKNVLESEGDTYITLAQQCNLETKGAAGSYEDGLDRLVRNVDNKDTLLLIQNATKENVGYIRSGLIENNTLQIYTLFVVPSKRLQGVAKKSLQQILTLAKEHGHTRVGFWLDKVQTEKRTIQDKLIHHSDYTVVPGTKSDIAVANIIDT